MGIESEQKIIITKGRKRGEQGESGMVPWVCCVTKTFSLARLILGSYKRRLGQDHALSVAHSHCVAGT